jgi:threonyl-tRNA synthetase
MVGFLIEHYAGNFPVWLSPEQVRVIPITDGQNEYAENIAKQLRRRHPRQRRPERPAHERQDPLGAVDEGAVHARGRRTTR